MPQQLQLNLTPPMGEPTPGTHIEVLCGLTPWILTAEAPPPYEGWWRTKEQSGRYARRWWDGEAWSIPVPLDPGDEGFTASARRIRCHHDHSQIIWCGLAAPHPAGYVEYKLVKSPQLLAYEALTKHEAV